MCDTMGGEGGSKGGRKSGGGRKPLFAFLSRFYFQCEEIPHARPENGTWGKIEGMAASFWPSASVRIYPAAGRFCIIAKGSGHVADYLPFLAH